jgi:predicted nuclease of predicted toxin-antitoxin system
MSLIRGQPPKIIWLRTGNQSKAGAVNVLLNCRERIEQVLTVEGKACVEIY